MKAVLLIIVTLVIELKYVAAQTGVFCPTPNGLFENPNSRTCRTFLQCTNGIGTIRRCRRRNNIFNRVLLRCAPGNQQTCNTFRINSPNRQGVNGFGAGNPGLGGPRNGVGVGWGVNGFGAGAAAQPGVWGTGAQPVPGQWNNGGFQGQRGQAGQWNNDRPVPWSATNPWDTVVQGNWPQGGAGQRNNGFQGPLGAGQSNNRLQGPLGVGIFAVQQGNVANRLNQNRFNPTANPNANNGVASP